MSISGRARRTASRAGFFVVTTAALTSPIALVSAWVRDDLTPPQEYATAIGERKRVSLGRSAAADLNTGSRMSVSITPVRCDVALERGEALFEVEHDDLRQLRVTAGETVVEAATSTFSVRVRDPTHVEVLVRTGTVVVGARKPRTVSANHIARVTPRGVTLKELSEADVARKLEWTTGHLSFSGETLAEAAAEFNRYNPQKLVIADRTIRTLAIGGKFKSTDPESFVAALQVMGVRALDPEASGTRRELIRLVGARGELGAPGQVGARGEAGSRGHPP